jgi:glycosyltransferase involved in cell wall biosynthesis
LQAEGVDFDFRLVEGVTQLEAKALYQQADLVVDQLLLWGYGGLAVEAMALGRPVIAHLREDDLAFLPPEMHAEIPVISADPATIYDVLKELLTTRRSELAEIGRRSRAYVTRWHDPKGIAEEVVADYEAAVARRSRPRRVRRAGRPDGG